MEHEPASTPERLSELPTGVFNFEKLSPEHLMALIEGLYATGIPDEESDRGDKKAIQVAVMVEQDLQRLVERSPEKAYEFYNALTESGNKWAKSVALDALAEPLMKRLSDDPEKRQELIERWVSLLDDEEDTVRDAAIHTLDLVEDDDWPDEPTAWYVAGAIERYFGRGDAYRSGGQ